MNRVAAVFGGSFDPPHIAHVLCSHYVLSVEPIDELLVVPVFNHAFDKELSDYELRVEMCEKAFFGDPRIVVSRIESELPAPSYTLQTIQALKNDQPERSLRLVLGTDVAHETDQWHRFSEVARLAKPLVVGRAQNGESGVDILPAISSSEIRTWYRQPGSASCDENLAKFVPWSVRDVIKRENLYK